MSKIPLVVRKDIKDAEAVNAEHLLKINATLGTNWALEIDYAAFYEQIKDTHPDYAPQVGSVSTWYMASLAQAISSFVQKDDMYKDALVEEVSANAIKAFKVVPQNTYDSTVHNKIAFEDGKLVIIVPENLIAVNIDDLGNTLEESL
ncbi:uncharacterized protein CANTADRAFT_180285 [Suhomyces tanzawaensis NRRL Y-17324]|uniref:Uncharacterized protein n=1 Tax=Suhomyces tanzawaensis NRRL Y-17324 TaxID=984487 RepID=A0A1E4SMZ2_9ASCO|nr:uncharacterized protein CANTADRAFT_180285 [Suhomyces tanzawaensis NRRL Y-17324]ODV80890.1 hypothetical protein CANTADRAFT_180285 [Suhomyces tanzawaensis NRRL Y-17324]